MARIRTSTAGLGLLFALLLVVLLALSQSLLRAHADETIHYVASDAGTYFNSYEDFYASLDLVDSAVLFLVGSPVLFMKLADGNLLLIQLCQLALMAISLNVAFDCLGTLRGRLVFLLCALAFPYFLFGFLSLNKEIYAMCSAIFYASYFVRGRRRDLLVALLLAMCARYYMLLALLAMLVLVPRNSDPRTGLILALLAVISVAAPLVKALVPQYSGEDLLEAPSTAGSLFSAAIDSYAYGLVYPLKYLALIPMRLYSFLTGTTRAGNAMEAVVSIVSLAMVLCAVWILLLRKRSPTTVRRLVVLGLVAPLPIMWSEIMHWRYYSFVYFFFLFAVVLHLERRGLPSRHPAVSSHA
jgi:hypothetical protein